MKEPKEEVFYFEVEFTGKYCFKYQPEGKPVIITVHKDRDTALKMMFDEINKMKRWQEMITE